VEDELTGFACRQFEDQECGKFYHDLDSYMLHCEKHHVKHKCQRCHDAFADEKNFKTHLQKSIECATFEKALNDKNEKEEKAQEKDGKGKSKGNGKEKEVPERGAAKRSEYPGASSIEEVLDESPTTRRRQQGPGLQHNPDKGSTITRSKHASQGHEIWYGMKIYTRQYPISTEEAKRLGVSFPVHKNLHKGLTLLNSIRHLHSVFYSSKPITVQEKNLLKCVEFQKLGIALQ